MKKEIKDFIKQNSKQPHTWLQKEINKKFGCVINLSTIRSAKKALGCLTNWKELRKSYIPFVKDNFEVLSDSEMATMLSTIYNRKISHHLIKRIRCENNLHREKGLTVKELRPCRACGKLIKITCRHPTQVFCSYSCAFDYQKKYYAKRNSIVATPDKIKSFIEEWKSFARTIIKDYGGELNPIEKDEVYADYMLTVPYIIYAFSKNEGNKKMQKGYIATAIKHLVYKKYNEITKKNKSQCSLNYEDHSDFISFKTAGVVRSA